MVRAYADQHLAADAVLGRLEADMLALAGNAPPPHGAAP